MAGRVAPAGTAAKVAEIKVSPWDGAGMKRTLDDNIAEVCNGAAAGASEVSLVPSDAATSNSSPPRVCPPSPLPGLRARVPAAP